jgi:RHS repeat-associated protein
MLMRSYIKKQLSLVLLLTFLITAVNAADESYIQSLSGKIKKGDSCTVIDDKFLNLPLDQWNQVRNLSVDNFITFELRQDTNIFYYNKPFTCTLNVSINYFSSRDQLTPTEIKNISLVVKYDTATGKFYPVYDRYSFKNAYKVTVVVNSITSPEWGNDLPAIFRIRNQILVQRKYPFTQNVNAALHFEEKQFEPENSQQGNANRVSTAIQPVVNQLLISWVPGDFPGAEEYDVEWTFIDALSDRGIFLSGFGAGPYLIPDATFESWMKNDNSRVTVTGSSYTINLPFTDGYVIARVRSAMYDPVTGIRNTSIWQFKDGINNTGNVACSHVDFHEQNLNWQYTVSYAEEGKRKEVISYFDGSLRSRQAVTITNSENIAIVAETIYDNMGRPAVGILPAPVNDNKLRYYPSLNKNQAGNPYSHTDISNAAGANCNISANGLNTSSGAAQYYSPNNTFIGDPNYYFTKYVPDSRGTNGLGYPLTLTEYTPDNTGRIRRQGGVGPDFQIGGGHETNYFYGKPLQSELDRLFGMEVGNASHYLKNMVVDPNGQASVSYVDANGKTIATALAGKAPGNLDELPSALTPDARKTMTQILMRPADFQVNPTSLLKEATATFLVAVKNVPFAVHYSIDPASLINSTTSQPWNGPGAGQQFCSNCYYEIEIIITNDCGEPVITPVSTTAFQLNSTTCAPDAQPFTGTVSFTPDKWGEYTVTYRLRLSEDVIKYQTDYYINNNSDLKKLQWFFEQELYNADLSGCYSDCQSCKLLTEEGLAGFTQKAQALLLKIRDEKFPSSTYLNFDINSSNINQWIVEQFNNIVSKCTTISANCVTSPCEQNLEMMKNDVRPGGQYALYSQDAVTLVYSITDDGTNVLKLYNTGITEIDNLSYEDDNGVTVHIKENGVYISESKLIQEYLQHPDWADAFVKQHIEYCSYLWCKDQSYSPADKNNEVSYTFDDNLRENIIKGQDAVNANFYNQSNYLQLSNVDPFFNGGRGSSYKTQLQNDLTNLSYVLKTRFKDQDGNWLPTKNIQQLIEWMLYCKPTSTTATAQDFIDSWTCFPVASCRSLTSEWELYRDYYLKIKSKYVRLAKLDFDPSCNNCFIGQDPISSVICEEPGPLTDYSFVYSREEVVSSTGSSTTIRKYYDLVYLNGTGLFKGSYKVVARANSSAYENGFIEFTTTTQKGLNRIKDASSCITINYTFQPPLNLCPESFSIISVTCLDGNPQQTCTNSGCPQQSEFRVEGRSCQFNGSGGIEWDECQVYFVRDAGPVNQDVNIQVLQREINYYPQTTTDSYFWVTIPAGQQEVYVGNDYNVISPPSFPQSYLASRNYGIAGVECENTGGLPSTCSSDPRALLYAEKMRIFNEYVNEQAYLNCMADNAPTTQAEIDAQSAASIARMKDQAIQNLKALHDPELVSANTFWVNKLKAIRDEENQNDIDNGLPPRFISISNSQIKEVCDHLYYIALRYIEIAPKSNIRPASTLPVPGDPVPDPDAPFYPTYPYITTSNGYNNYSQVFESLIGPSLVQKGFGPHLLGNLYPYDKTPVELNPNISTIAGTDICAKVDAMRDRWHDAGNPGTFYSYLQQELKEDFKLTEGEFSDLETRCANNCSLLNEPLLLPAVFAPTVSTNNNYVAWKSCNEINNLYVSFQNTYPNVTANTKLYRNLLTNFMNTSLGYALSYDDYEEFKNTTCVTNSNAVLYAKPASPAASYDQELTCVENILRSAFDKAGQEYEFYIETERVKFRNAYISKCLSTNASAKLEGEQYEYHYTLYYYDQSGNLVKTIPPEGVDLLSDAELELVEDFRDDDPSCNGDGIPATENASATFNALSTGLQNSTTHGTEMWLYNGTSSSSRQVRIITPDNKYMYQAAIYQGKLWFELYTLTPGSSDVSITLSNEAVADVSALSLQQWSHLQIQSTASLTSGTLQLYLDGRKLTNTTGTLPPYPFEWEIAASGGTYTLPAPDIAVLKHFRIYDRTATDAEVWANYKNSCLAPVDALAIQSSPLQYWGRFNIPPPGSATTTGPGSTTEYVNRFIVPDHGIPTFYAYNSLNQVIKQTSPDGGTSEFHYDRLSRLIISQNAEQKTPTTFYPDSENPANRYSYTKYDALGRITVVGEKVDPSSIVNEDLVRGFPVDGHPDQNDPYYTSNPNPLLTWFASGTNRQVTVTAYDVQPAWVPASLTGTQKNLRKRVVASAILATAANDPDPSQNRIAASYYSYDLIGNVNTLVQENTDLKNAEQSLVTGSVGLKKIQYQYDLVSGKVNKVLYQDGKWDQFYYQYLYDADNRVVKALSSRNNYSDAGLWVTEATYRYYLHGPLARMELGNYKVQGVDYAYTLQGWLKGVNSQSLDPLKDMSGDGKLGDNNYFLNSARDVYGFSLGYYNKNIPAGLMGDYAAIDGGANAFELQYQPPSYNPSGEPRNFETGKNLFNGNISNATYAIKQLENGSTVGYTYRYDQLNRLTGMRRNNIGTGATTWNNTSIIEAYKEEISYDANGNIKTYQRNGNLPASGYGMDNMTYNYNVDNNGRLVNNKLRNVDDDIAPNLYTKDINDHTEDIDDQDADNYTYDNIGNLVKDNAGKIVKINWTVYGKIKHIIFQSDPATQTTRDIDYRYDASGNRLTKYVLTTSYAPTPPPPTQNYTYYVRDAQGNVLAVYNYDPGGPTASSLTWGEQHLYGSSRLGMVNPDFTVTQGQPLANDNYNPTGDPITNGTLGKRTYELSNHLGNVLATINDIKTGVDAEPNGTTDYYIATVLSANDYYPFGMLQPGRKYEAGGGYRYGFNGKENDNEVKGEGNQQDYGMRVYDSRLGRFLSTDPISKSYPMLTPYQFASNRPIDGIDMDGLEYARYKLTVDNITGKIVSGEIIWNNPNQHNEYGSRGQGVLYEISVWDSKLKKYQSVNVETMVKRNASTLFGLLSTEYGNYMGATGLKKVGADGGFTDKDDYSIPPVDAVDNYAYQHDKGYDILGSKGENGLFDDWGTTPVDEAALNGWKDFRANFNVGDADPYNEQKVTSSERKAAWKGMTLFSAVISDKKASISKFMRAYYADIAYKKSPSMMGPKDYAKSVEYNYQLFLKTYMEKDDKGNWQRKKDMWTKDVKGNWIPNKPKKS